MIILIAILLTTLLSLAVFVYGGLVAYYIQTKIDEFIEVLEGLIYDLRYKR